MNKRSAMLVAAGLVLTLVVGGVAVAVGMTGPEASSAQPKLTQHKKNKPIVKTTKKTVTVHKKAKAQAGDRRDRARHLDRRRLVERAAPAARTTTAPRAAATTARARATTSGRPSDEPSRGAFGRAVRRALDDGGSGVEDD